jgi:hypothetical protein
VAWKWSLLFLDISSGLTAMFIRQIVQDILYPDEATTKQLECPK